MAVSFATFDNLQDWTSEIPLNERTVQKSVVAKAANKDTFLSYSSKDAQFLPGVIKLLENHGASVYCDLTDDRLPRNPTPETASIIKAQIGRSVRLVMFVTVNSKDSRWVPWELGIGDVKLSATNVALLPVAKQNLDQDWAKQEYLGLYRHIVHGRMEGESDPLWMGYDHRTNSATTLGSWCRHDNL